MPIVSKDSFAAVEATVSSKGQVTLPSELRRRLGIQQGSRVRFILSADGEARMEPVRLHISDLWRMADEGEAPTCVLSFDEMNAAKVRRKP